MNNRITPCLWYNAQAKQAAEMYCKAFEKAKITAESPIVTEVNLSGQSFTLLDGGPKYKPNASISFYYVCETEKELERAWQTLGKDGKILMPLDKYPWGEKYGWVNDPFGISWQLGLGKISDVGQKITPCFLFTGKQYGKADQAIEHYSSIFQDVLVDGILRYGTNEAPEQEGKIKHAQFSLNGQKFMIMESAQEHDLPFTEGVSLTLHCDTQEQIDYYWSRLTERGEESMCGWLKDQFGISWQIIPVVLSKIMSDPAKAGKAAQAFMSMRKFNIEQLVQASLA